MGILRNYEASVGERARTGSLSGEALRTMLGSDPIQNALMNSLDLSSISKEWDKTFAQPAMEAWWKYNAPGIRDEYAGIPGAFFSADRGRGVSQAANQYMAQAVQPQLFSALQAARANMPNMISAVTNPLAQLAQGAVGTVQDTGSGGIGPLLGGMLGMGTAGLLGGGLSQMFTPEAMRMGQFGSMAGGLFG